MIISLTKRKIGVELFIYRAALCHGNTDVIGEGATAEEAIKNMAEGIRNEWADETRKPAADTMREGR